MKNYSRKKSKAFRKDVLASDASTYLPCIEVITLLCDITKGTTVLNGGRMKESKAWTSLAS